VEHVYNLSENLKGRDHSEDLDVDGKINIRIYVEEIRWEFVDWIHEVHIGDQWRVLVNTVMNRRVT
jgi:hypothetical protein